MIFSFLFFFYNFFFWGGGGGWVGVLKVVDDDMAITFKVKKKLNLDFDVRLAAILLVKLYSSCV
jgi:hypothetical protein